MAGSGKTTFMQRINSYLHGINDPPYVMNLDPAVKSVPFESNIDIRDSVNYKEVMKQYNLGPNGGILTALNLFATKVDQILAILEKRTAVPPPQTQTPAPTPKQIRHILVDTPGQIEVFVWSASGDILLGSLASSFPTVIAYVIDTPRTAATSTFMSNMLYACSILYKTKLPMVLVFNKTDVQDAAFAQEWMTDFEAFQEALRREEDGGGAGQGSGYMGSLLHSMSLVLEEFYKHLKVVGVSSMTGAGVPEFFAAVEEKKAEFERDYRPELERRRRQRQADKEKHKEKELGRLLSDLNVGVSGGGSGSSGGKGKRPPKRAPETISDAEDDSDDDDDDNEDDDGNGLVERDEDEDDMERDDQDGLNSRYKRAMEDNSSGGGGGPSGEDFSFAKYLHKSSMG
jgi:hypothetical protein